MSPGSRPVLRIIARATPWLMAASFRRALVALAERASPPIDASQSQPQSQPQSQTQTQSQAAPAPQGDEKQAKAMCGVCHPFPQPDILTRNAWRDEFVRMMFIRQKRLPPIGNPSTVNRG